MTAYEPVEDVVQKLANGEAIDWDLAEQSTSDPEEVAILQQLRVLERLADAHRSFPLPPAAPQIDPDEETREGPVLRWGRYRLVREIGAGKYGSVYLAHDPVLDRDIAIKLLHPSLAADADMAARVREEGRKRARVHNPNVITVYDVEEHQGQLGLCMEYIDGHTLTDHVRSNGPLNADEALPMGEAVCQGLAAVHEAGLLHRDIKATNVMRERAGRIVLMDFGAGLDVTDGGAAFAPAIGTPTYMAPEVLDGQAASQQSDVYSVGILLYFLVTGAYPVLGKSLEEIRAAHKAGNRKSLIERRPDLPEGFLDAVDQATAADPRTRLASPALLLKALRSDAEPSVWEQRAKKTAVIAFGLLACAVFSGYLTTYTFNAAVDRPRGFAAESFGSIVKIGFQSMLTPIVSLFFLLGLGAAINLVIRLLPFGSDGGPSLLDRLTARVNRRERASVLAQALVLAGIVAFILTVQVVFPDVAYSFANSISRDALDLFEPLRSQQQRLLYRWAVPAMLAVVVAGWLRVRRIAKANNATVPVWVQATGATVVVALLMLSQAPYKAMVQNEMPVVLVDGTRCYRLGALAEDVRVFCPAWPVPRVRTVRSTERTIQGCGIDENVFLAQPGGGCEPAAALEGK